LTLVNTLESASRRFESGGWLRLGDRARRNLREAPAFSKRIDEFPPDAELIFALAQGFVIFGPKSDPQVTPPVFNVNASYTYADRSVQETTTVDLRPFEDSNLPVDPVSEEIKTFREEFFRRWQEVTSIGV
jgi:hypothetical protein